MFFQKSLHPSALEESSLSIGRVKVCPSQNKIVCSASNENTGMQDKMAGMPIGITFMQRVLRKILL